jgi:hypothetical protein
MNKMIAVIFAISAFLFAAGGLAAEYGAMMQGVKTDCGFGVGGGFLGLVFTGAAGWIVWLDKQ